MDIEFPYKLQPFVESPKRINILKGGRGGSKSWTIAELFLILGMNQPHRFLCTREIQKSIKESVHQLLSDKIIEKGYPYKVLDTKIVTDPVLVAQGKLPQTEFIFHGLQDRTAMNLKSLEGVTWCWVEEAQSISKKSLDLLIPTIRKENSKLVFSYNPEEEDDPIALYFDPTVDKDVLEIEINFYDNPFFPEILKKEEERSKAKAERTGDWSDYKHIWLGQPISRKGKVFNNWQVKEFNTESFDSYRNGIDWGFSNDPFAFTRNHYDRARGKLYICDEIYEVGLLNEDSAKKVKEIIGDEAVCCDSAEPKSIQEYTQLGISAYGAKKGKGSIEYGVKFMQSLEIIIHPKCVNTIKEFKKYSYQEDKNGKILPIIKDEWNNAIDSIRYSLENDSHYNEADAEITLKEVKDMPFLSKERIEAEDKLRVIYRHHEAIINPEDNNNYLSDNVTGY